jgi:hypothetical protein
MNSTSLSYPVPQRDSFARRLLFALTHPFSIGFRQRDPLAHATKHALALPPRGGVARDVLHVQSVSAGIHVEWMARPLHPWDGDLPTDLQDEAFANQCLEDVDVALARLFAGLETVEQLEIAVLHPQSCAKILTGLVSRADFVAAKRLPIPMRLKMAGIAYDTGRGGLRPVSQ